MTGVQRFLMPHSHQDPGWVKTFEQYYVQQVTAIFRTMIKKLNEHRDFRFIYAEARILFLLLLLELFLVFTSDVLRPIVVVSECSYYR